MGVTGRNGKVNDRTVRPVPWKVDPPEAPIPPAVCELYGCREPAKHVGGGDMRCAYHWPRAPLT